MEELIKELLRKFTDPEVTRLCIASIANLHMTYNYYSPSWVIITFVDLISSSTDEEVRNICAFLLASVLEKESTGKFICLFGNEASAIQVYYS